MNRYLKLPLHRLIQKIKESSDDIVEIKTHLETYSNKRSLPTGIKTKEIILQAPPLRTQVIQKLGGKCVGCGITDERTLQLDHIRGWGNKDKRRGSDKHRWILNNLGEARQIYQLLCANCNWIKRHENNETPSRIDTIMENAQKMWDKL